MRFIHASQQLVSFLVTSEILCRYKTSDGKAINALSNDGEPTSLLEAANIISECHEKWKNLIASGTSEYPSFWLGTIP